MLRRAMLAACRLPVTMAVAQPWWDERREDEHWRRVEIERRREAERRHERWEEARERRLWIEEQRHRRQEEWEYEHRR